MSPKDCQSGQSVSDAGEDMNTFIRNWAFALLPVVASAATIRIDPVSSGALVGGAVNVSVSVDDVVDLYAYQFDLAFDPTVVSAMTLTEGDFPGGGGGTFFIPGSINNTTGAITFVTSTLLGPVPGVNGSGFLATVRFNALTPGTSALMLSNVLLLDSTGGDIAAGIQNGSVTVTVEDVPEPVPALLLAGGLGAIFTFRHRLRASARKR